MNGDAAVRQNFSDAGEQAGAVGGDDFEHEALALFVASDFDGWGDRKVALLPSGFAELRGLERIAFGEHFGDSVFEQLPDIAIRLTR